MQCDRYRAELLQSDLGLEAREPSPGLSEHVLACPECRAWRSVDADLTARLDSAAMAASPDFVPPVLAAWHTGEPAGGRWSFPWARLALLLVGILQAVIGVDSMLFNHSHGAGDSGAFVAAIGIGFVLAAVQPQARFAGLLPVALAASGLMLFHIVWDIAGGSVGALDEAYHGPTLLGVIVLLTLRILELKHPMTMVPGLRQRG